MDTDSIDTDSINEYQRTWIHLQFIQSDIRAKFFEVERVEMESKCVESVDLNVVYRFEQDLNFLL